MRSFGFGSLHVTLLVRSSKLETKDALSSFSCQRRNFIAFTSQMASKWGGKLIKRSAHIKRARRTSFREILSLSLGGPDRLSGCRRTTFAAPPMTCGTRENAFAESSLRSLYWRDVWRKQRRAYTFEWPRDYPANGLQIQFGRVGCASEMSASGDAARRNLIFAMSAAAD